MHNTGIVEMGDGTLNTSSDYGNFPYKIQTFADTTLFHVNQLSHQNDAILGKAWLYNY